MKRLSHNVVVVALAVAAALGLFSCTGADDPPKQAYEVGYCGEPASCGGAIPARRENLVYFSAAKLASQVGGEVRSIKVAYGEYAGNPATRDFTIRLYGAGTTSSPGTKLFDKVVTLSQGWNEVPLDSPIAIDGDTELWAGYEVDLEGCWPVALDAEANVPNTSYAWIPDAGAYYRLMSNNYCVRLIIWK
jgi:hypothetical protein